MEVKVIYLTLTGAPRTRAALVILNPRLSLDFQANREPLGCFYSRCLFLLFMNVDDAEKNRHHRTYRNNSLCIHVHHPFHRRIGRCPAKQSTC